MNQSFSRMRLEGITKSFHGKTVNDRISFAAGPGEIIGLLGENGAGKTTLMNILFGLYQPDGGQIFLDDREVRIRNPREALALGLGMVHQHFMLVPGHSVLDNLATGVQGLPFFFPHRELERRIHEFRDQFALDMDLHEKAYNLSAGQLQRVEILKTLLNGARLLILDEPTSVLGPQESAELFRILKDMAARGRTIIIITHKLEEILELCNRVLVLRKGVLCGDFPAAGTDKGVLAEAMVGRHVELSLDHPDVVPGECILDVRGLQVPGDRGQEAVRGLDFQVHQGEIFGIAGVSGNGQRELAESLTGLRKASGGTVLLDGQDVTNSSVKTLATRGMGHIPEERMRFGIVPNLLLYENAVLKDYHTEDFSDDVFLKKRAIKEFAEVIVENFRVASPGIHVPIKHLSGGNIQKLILGREISGDPTLLVASHPTYGLDVGASTYIHQELLKRRESGGAVLLLSEDLDEVLNLADRIAVMYQGRFMGILDRKTADMRTLGLMMAGVAPSPGATVSEGKDQ